MEEIFRNNGYLVQGRLENIPVQKYMNYNGIGRFVSWPLFHENDSWSRVITQEAEERWIDNNDISAINDEEFIKKYFRVCVEKNIKTRVLLIQSLAFSPILQIVNENPIFLGYDYSQGDYHFSLLIDDILMSKYYNITEFDKVFNKLNENLLFSRFEDIKEYVTIREKLKLQNKYDFEFDYCAQIVKISIVNVKG